MKKASTNILVAMCGVVVAVLLLAEEVEVAKAVTCNPIELSPCLAAITGGTPPSKICCSKLKEQEPCLCGYIKDPNYSKYINSPGAKKVADACGVAIPTC